MVCIFNNSFTIVGNQYHKHTGTTWTSILTEPSEGAGILGRTPLKPAELQYLFFGLQPDTLADRTQPPAHSKP